MLNLRVIFSYVILEDHLYHITDFRSNDRPQEAKMFGFLLFSCKVFVSIFLVNCFEVCPSNPLVTLSKENRRVAIYGKRSKRDRVDISIHKGRVIYLFILGNAATNWSIIN